MKYKLIYDEEYYNWGWSKIKKDSRCICGDYGVSLIEEDYIEEFKSKYNTDENSHFEDFERIYEHIVEDLGYNQDSDTLNFYVGHDEFETELKMKVHNLSIEDIIKFIKKESFRDKFYNKISATLIYKGMIDEMEYFLSENKKYIDKKYLKDLQNSDGDICG